MSLSPRIIALLGLAALIPGAVYILVQSETIAAIALLNVVLIVSALFVALSPHEDHEVADGAI
ncbi:MAG: hypothetical protein V5A39_10995 [Haloarculaceae archaeon]|jgi:hypothetical protein